MSRSAITLASYRKTSIEGIKEIRARIADLLDHLTAEHIKDIAMEAGQILYDELHATAPGPSEGNKDFPPGTLKDGIFIGRGKATKPNIQVGIGAHQNASTLAGWLEFGTVKMDAQPFFRPALTTTRPEMAYVMGDGLRTILIEKVVAK